MALVDGDDLVQRYDKRRLAELAGDAGARLDVGTIAEDANVVIAINDAIDMLLAAVRVSSRYTLEDLDAADEPAVGGTGKPLVKRLVCDLVFGLLTARRGYTADEQARLAPRYAAAEQMLQALRDGNRILDSDTHADAGLPSSERFRPLGSQTPSLLSDAYRLFGYRTYCPPYRW